MDKEQILKIQNECLFPDTCHQHSTLYETHISWVVLTDQYAFKVKRPVKLSFVDFSTLEKRKYFCHQEVDLNRRLAPEMYLDVYPITRKMIQDNSNSDDEDQNEIIDYAVQMRRMDNDKQMDKMLQENQVSDEHISALARKIADFHKNTRIVKNAFNTARFQKEYADIELELAEINQRLGQSWGEKVSNCIRQAYDFLNDHRSYCNDRILNDFQRDCHGDLNASNILLYKDPVIFDCIEFSEDYRIIDVLNDIAFLCVDLDFHGRNDLSEELYQQYLEIFGIKEDELSKQLFAFYKSYRANIRAKVSLINIVENPQHDQNVKPVKQYIELMDAYCHDFI